jgi:hypothetical protein
MRGLIAVLRASLRVLVAWCRYSRALLRADEETLTAMRTIAKLPAQRLLAEVSAAEIENVVQRLYRLRVQCEVSALDFGEMVEFASDFRDFNDDSWIDALDAALCVASGLERIEGWEYNPMPLRRTSSRSRYAEPSVDPEKLDTPNRKLPFANRG